MENHPIPQDVTGFKFKLIGSVTVKQFLYILGGGILAFVFFMVPISPFIKIPLSIICGSVGAALAFIPIEGRPMDVMMKNFLKALPAENQFIYKKRGAEALIVEFLRPQTVASVKVEAAKTQESESLDKRRALLYKTLKKSYNPDVKEQEALTNINSYLHDEATHSASPPVQNVDAMPREIPEALQIVTPSVTIATKEVVQAPADFSPVGSTPSTSPQAVSTENGQQPAASSQEPTSPDPQVLISIAQKVDTVTSHPSMVGQNPLTMAQSTVASQQSGVALDTPMAKPSPQVQQVETAPQSPHSEGQSPHVDQLVTNGLPQEASPMQVTMPQKQADTSVAPNETANVTTIAPEASLKAGFPSLPDTPNIVMGIIKDPRGKVLPNVLVEIMDQQGIPVRAFKANALGQFMAATPLPNGDYNVLLDDPRKQNEFGQIHITLTGEIFDPLEIVSVDQREKLRRELFGNTQGAQIQAAQ